MSKPKLTRGQHKVNKNNGKGRHKVDFPDRSEQGRFRGYLAVGVLLIFGTAILGSLIYGMITGLFFVLEKVALVLMGPVGYVLGYYMGR